jgi:hypothetical protein
VVYGGIIYLTIVHDLPDDSVCTIVCPLMITYDDRWSDPLKYNLNSKKVKKNWFSRNPKLFLMSYLVKSEQTHRNPMTAVGHTSRCPCPSRKRWCHTDTCAGAGAKGGRCQVPRFPWSGGKPFIFYGSWRLVTSESLFCQYCIFLIQVDSIWFN